MHEPLQRARRIFFPSSMRFTPSAKAMGGHSSGSWWSWPNRRTKARQIAGGYVQFASRQYDQAKPQSYAAFANAIVAGMKLRVGKDHWEIDFVGKPVSFKFDNEPNGIYPSLMLWFFANARGPLAALQSRERLIKAIEETSTLLSAIESFLWESHRKHGQPGHPAAPVTPHSSPAPRRSRAGAPSSRGACRRRARSRSG